MPLTSKPSEEALLAAKNLRLGDLFAGEIAAIHEPVLGRSLLSFGQSQGPKAVEIPAGVAVVKVHGPLLQRGWSSWWGTLNGYDNITDAFAAACADPSVEAILLHVDSPGGMVAGCFEAVRRMQAARDKSGKPVVAFADELAASAAYAISCVADVGIYGPATAEIGSVGAIIVHMSEARALEDFGIDVSVFRSGSRKAEGNWFEKLSDEARAALQASVDETGKDFAKLVGASRGKDASEVLGWKAAVFGAREAVKLGVADKVASLEQAAQAAINEAKSRRRKKTTMKINAALGLNETATEEEGVAAATKAKAAEGERDQLLAALDAKSVSEGLGKIDGLNETAKAHAMLAAERAKLEADRKQIEAEQLVKEGRELGKITPATEADWLEDAKADIERTKAKLTRAPVVIPRDPPKEKGAAAAGKTWEEHTAEELGELQRTEPEKFNALLDEYRARTGRRR